MIKFKKAYNLKIISIVISLVFCLNTLVYSLDIQAKTHLRPLLIFDRDAIKAEELLEEWREKYKERADIFLSMFGDRVIKDPWARESIESVLDVAMLEEEEPDYSKLPWKINWLYQRSAASYPNIGILVNLLNGLPKLKTIKIPEKTSHSFQVRFQAPSKGSYDIYITTNNKKVTDQLTDVNDKNRSLPQPVFYLRISLLTGKDNVNRLFVAQFQYINRTYDKTSEELQVFKEQTKEFAWQVIQHCSRNSNFIKQPCKYICFFTPEHILNVLANTGLSLSEITELYAHFPQKSGFKVVVLDEKDIPIPSSNEKNFIWEFPINQPNTPIDDQLLAIETNNTNL